MARPRKHDLKSILAIVADNPQWSNRAHAKLLGISESTIRRARKLADNPPRRRHVLLSESQFAQLKAEAERQGVSVSALIAQIVNDYLAQGPD
jgi:tmRNA-binding protein